MGKRAIPRLTFAQLVAIGIGYLRWTKTRNDSDFAQELGLAGVEVELKDGKIQ